MSANSPTRPGTGPEMHEETKRILDERLTTFDEDVKQAMPAEHVIREGRAKLAKLKDPSPR